MLRRRRSIKSILDEASAIELGLAPIPKSIHNFWKSLKSQTKKRSISWLSAGSSKTKRSADYLPSLEEHELNDPLEETFHPLIPHLHSNTVKRNIDVNFFEQGLYSEIMESDPSYIARHKKRSISSRRKRSTEEELLEISSVPICRDPFLMIRMYSAWRFNPVCSLSKIRLPPSIRSILRTGVEESRRIV